MKNLGLKKVLKLNDINTVSHLICPFMWRLNYQHD